MNQAEKIKALIAQLERAIAFEEWTMAAQYPYSESDYEIVDGEKIYTAEYLKSMPSGCAYCLGRYETLTHIRDRLEECLETAMEDPLDQPRFKIVFDDEEESDSGDVRWN